MSGLRFPTSALPTGWFQVGWSHDLVAGEVKALQYFGDNLVMWRGLSGEVFVQSAYCLHLGAHRGVGGWVTGDDLACPWHGWEWDGAGRNTRIPYSKEGSKPGLRIRTYPVREWCGLVVIWHDREGGEPTWEPPPIPEYDDPAYYPMHPVSNRLHRIRAHPQMPVENLADPAHLVYVHGSAALPRVLDFEVDGHRLGTNVEVLYGGGRDRTGLTPDGEVRSVVRMEAYGIGIGVTHWDDGLSPTVQLTCWTPIDDEYTDYWFSQTSKRTPGDTGPAPSGMAMQMLKTQWKIIEQDFFTWENMTYLEQPTFAAEESRNYAALRRWAQQFYPE